MDKSTEVLQGALDLPIPERTRFLDTACGSDEALKNEARSLVEAYDEAGEFMEQPAMAQDAYVLLGDGINRQWVDTP